MYDWNDDRIVTSLFDIEGRASEKSVALTFDDGPNEYTNSLLTILNKHSVPATFFWLTSQFDQTGKMLVKELLAAGHTLGLHGYRHLPHHTLSEPVQRRELLKGIKQIKEVLGNQELKYFRPPYGRYNDDTLNIINEYRLQPILWDIASLDWEIESDGEEIINNVVNNVKDGSIVLLHDLPQTVEILEELIVRMKNLGYKFVSL